MKLVLLSATLAALALPAQAAHRHRTYEDGYGYPGPEIVGVAPGHRPLYPQDDPERAYNQTYHANGSVNADENFGYTTNGPAATAAH